MGKLTHYDIQKEGKILEKVNDELDDMRMWRNQIYGAKAIAIAIGLLILHTSAVMGSFVALINYMNK